MNKHPKNKQERKQYEEDRRKTPVRSSVQRRLAKEELKKQETEDELRGALLRDF